MDLFDYGIFTDALDRYFVFDGRGRVLCSKSDYDEAERVARRPGEITILRACRVENGHFTLTYFLFIY